MAQMPGKSKVYLDHNATTGLWSSVSEALPGFLTEYGNPSSIHWAGRAPKQVLRETRRALAEILGVNALELIFTSGGSESNNTVLRGLWDLVPGERREFITTAVEHPSVLKTFEDLEARGAIVHRLRVNRDGEIDREQYRSLLGPQTLLVSIMLANNETGTIFPIRELAAEAHAAGALFHSDCVQGLGKIPVNLSDLGVDYASFSAHKVHALKGTGVLYVKRGSPYQPLIRGGAQERSRRGGTENTLGIFALGQVLPEIRSVAEKVLRMRRLRDLFEARLLNEMEGVEVTAGRSNRLPNTSSLVIKGVDGETLLMSLDLKGFAVSTGAACSSGNPEPSPVLLAVGLSREEAQSSLRVSLGWATTDEDVQEFLEALKVVVHRIRGLATKGAESHVSSF